MNHGPIICYSTIEKSTTDCSPSYSFQEGGKSQSRRGGYSAVKLAFCPDQCFSGQSSFNAAKCCIHSEWRTAHWYCSREQSIAYRHDGLAGIQTPANKDSFVRHRCSGCRQVK
jgi:hypothetical protein